MQYRRFGRTGLQMPLFSCGGMRYQCQWQDVPLSQVPLANQRNLEATISRALELGINHIETARGYGSSERQLGAILPKLPREKLIVQTKVAPHEDADKFTADFEDSLKRLKLDYMDLFSLHGVNDAHVADISLRPGGCLEAARKIQKRGLARHIGFSTHAPTEVILRCIRHPEHNGFDYINLHWYWIFQLNLPAIEEAARHDMGVFIISPSDKGGKLYDPPDKLVKLTQPLPPMQFNDLFCLSNPNVHTLSIGAARPSDFDLHVQMLPLLEKANEILPPILKRLENARADLHPTLRDPFHSALPYWEQAPGQMNLQMIFWLLGMMRAYDMIAYGQMRYAMLGNSGHWVPGSNAGNIDQHVAALKPIAQKCGLDGQLLDMLREAHAMFFTEPKKPQSQN
ncbi:MAG: aldo/keto reductase [Phycisphaeraceae bacterium]|nr:aldo/keto reductase [Phycisphaeraceae bacterium]